MMDRLLDEERAGPTYLRRPEVAKAVIASIRKGASNSSARIADQLLGLTGRPFWQDENYDHLVRNQKQFERFENYTLDNPVRAGLAQSAEEYPWSSLSSPAG